MDHMVNIIKLRWYALFFSIFFGFLIQNCSGGYHNGLWMKDDINSLLTKVELTQKGYIQFLRYVEDVPLITEYTFCIWMKSYDLSNSHPLLSYSKNEKDRLIRVWISRRGKFLNLELMGHPVFEIPTNFKEHQWYHVCQSWDSTSATWEIFINEKKFRGRSSKLAGLVLPEGGDLVVGQEYTDFNKGLEDGIEGEISGFNFVLSATYKLAKSARYSEPSIRFPGGYRRRRSFTSSRSWTPRIHPHHANEKLLKIRTLSMPWENTYLSSFISMHNNDIFSADIPGNRIPFNPPKSLKINPSNGLLRPHFSVYDGFSSEAHKSTGLMLVELSKNCRIGKGGPLRGEKVLINWAETKVRIFGGAIVKNVKPFC